MQKTREDFVGSTITQNVKYSDNAWQCYGSVDRRSVYTSENILDLILENITYDRDKSAYSYQPRASAGNTVYPAVLSHDIILVNALAYQSTNTVSYSTIQNLQNFLSYAILITNPVYNSLSKTKVIKLIDLNTWESLPNVTLLDFANCFLGDLTDTGDPRTQTARDQGIDNFIKNLLGKYVSTTVKASLSADTTLAVFASAVESNNKKDAFESDFGLWLHDPRSVKLPFYDRKDSEEEYSSNIVNYFSRVLANTSLSGVTTNTLSKYYIEKLSDKFEDAISKDGALKKGLGTGLDEAGISTEQKDTNDKVVSVSGYDFRGDLDEERAYILAKSVIVNREAMMGGYGEYIPKLYLGELEASDPLSYHNSFGIHLINPLDKTTIFREDDSKYSVYGSLIIGYNYVDALLTQRTFLGSALSFLSSTTSADNAFNSDGVANMPTLNYTDDMQHILKSTYYEYCLRTYGKMPDNSAGVYYSLNALARIALLGKGHNPSSIASDMSETLRGGFKFVGDLEGLGSWLQNETFLVKAPIYGDFVEPVNFDQDLHPNSSVVFKHLRLHKSINRISPYDDSKTEVPYISKTAPLISLSKEEKGFGKLASDALPGLGNESSDVEGIGAKTSPAYFYDYNKGEEEEVLIADPKSETNGSKQRVRSLEGGLSVEGEIESITIDEIWTALKLLLEASGNTDKGYRLPSFFGIKSSSVGVSSTEAVVLNPKASRPSDTYIDILDWEPVTVNSEPFYDSKTTPEKQYKGFQVNKYIPKILDYKVNLFGRSDDTNKKVLDKVYEFNTESGDYDDVNNYMIPVLNQTILAFDTKDDKEWDDKDRVWNDATWKTKVEDGVRSSQQDKVWSLLHSIFDWNSNETLHNHYKKYLDNPKNLKTIERDLEIIRQNMLAFAEYVATTSVLKGALDRRSNRGTLHTLHRNSYEFDSTFLMDDILHLRDAIEGAIPLSESVVDLDKKVVYKDGNFENRYKHENFDAYTMDVSGKVTNTRTRKNDDGTGRAPANETFLSEVYMGADGLWHSIHEYVILPIVDCEY